MFVSLKSVAARITRPPSQLIVEEGKDAVLTCEAWGSPLPSMSWTKTPGHLPSGRFVLTGGNLTLSKVNKSDGGIYTCSASNVFNRDTASTQLMVIPPLMFTKRPPDTTKVSFGETVTLHCQAYSGSVTPTISWSKIHGQLPQGHRVLRSGSLVIKVTSVSDSGIYKCIARNVVSVITANTTIMAFARTCSDWRSAGFTSSKTYTIDPDGTRGVSAFSLFCDMTDKGGVGVTVISHDSEARTYVKGCHPRGCYSRNVRYNGVSKAQLVRLIGASLMCEQFIRYECHNSVLLYNGNHYGWWVSRDGQKMTYWGGATPGNGKCACGVTNSCVTKGNTCNCDSNDDTWREDSRLLRDKSTLPVSQLRFGDTGYYYAAEKGYHTLGKFKCYWRA